MNNFTQRILTGSLFVAVLSASIWWGPLSFLLLFSVIALLSLHEFYHITQSESIHPNTLSGLLAGLVSYGLIGAFAYGGLEMKFLALVPIPYCFIFFTELYRKKEAPFTNIAFTLLGVIYTVVPFTFLLLIGFNGGHWTKEIVLGYFLLLWSSDSFAYVFGNLLGKTRLFERISPKKSWEGSIGGGLSTLGIAWVLSLYFPQLNLIQWLGCAVLIVVFGTMGDLTESMLKRSIGVKDSGSLLPGHGGMLDRFDGLFLSSPFVWAWLQLSQLLTEM